MTWPRKRIGKGFKRSVECKAVFLSHSSCSINQKQKSAETFSMDSKCPVNIKILMMTKDKNQRPLT